MTTQKSVQLQGASSPESVQLRGASPPTPDQELCPWTPVIGLALRARHMPPCNLLLDPPLGRTNVTDRRQTDGWWHTASRSLKMEMA